MDKFRKSFGMVFPIVTKLLPNDERLFFTPNQAEEREVRLKASGGWLDELVDGQWVRSNPWICVPLALKTMFFFLSTIWLFHLQANGRDLDIAIDVEAIVFWGQHHGAVIHQSHVETLGVFHLGSKMTSSYFLNSVPKDHSVNQLVNLVSQLYMRSVF